MSCNGNTHYKTRQVIEDDLANQFGIMTLLMQSGYKVLLL